MSLLPPQKFREISLQALYARELYPFEEGKDLRDLLMSELKVSKRHVTKALEFVETLWEKRGFLDEKLSSVSKEYTLERIQKMDLSILRLACYELFFDSEIPGKVALAEAVRLARKFSTPEAGSFVNGLLDALYQGLDKEA